MNSGFFQVMGFSAKTIPESENNSLKVIIFNLVFDYRSSNLLTTSCNEL